jgi:hypothetical protein
MEKAMDDRDALSLRLCNVFQSSLRTALVVDQILEDGWHRGPKVNDLAALTAERDAEREARMRLEAALREIAEGNLGVDPWQAGFDKIREVARAALRALRETEHE